MRVDAVVRTLPVLGDISGTIVTVLLPESSSVALGQQCVFHTVGASFGAQIVVRAIAIEPNVAGTGDATPATPRDRRLVDQVSNAVAIVRGEIVTFEAARPSVRLTEHDPATVIARVRVRETMKGRTPPVIHVALRTSIDVLWRQSVSPNAGDVAIFLLGQPEPVGVGEALTTYEVDDVRADDALDDIRSIVASL